MVAPPWDCPTEYHNEESDGRDLSKNDPAAMAQMRTASGDLERLGVVSGREEKEAAHRLSAGRVSRFAQTPGFRRELLARDHVTRGGHATRPELVFADAPRFLPGGWLAVSLEKEHIARLGNGRELGAHRPGPR